MLIFFNCLMVVKLILNLFIVILNLILFSLIRLLKICFCFLNSVNLLIFKMIFLGLFFNFLIILVNFIEIVLFNNCLGFKLILNLICLYFEFIVLSLC